MHDRSAQPSFPAPTDTAEVRCEAQLRAIAAALGRAAAQQAFRQASPLETFSPDTDGARCGDS